MEEKMIARLNDLSMIEFQDLALSLRNGMYTIVSSKPTENNMPEGLVKAFTARDAYQYILDDPEADVGCFALAFPSGQASVVVPIGVYGVTPAHQVYFPLQINAFGRAFIMMSFDEFNLVCPASGNGDNRSRYAVLLRVREELIRRMFDYYYGLSEELNPVMAWAARNPNSPTRKIAERLLFKRIEIGEMNDRSEVYSRKDFQEKDLAYLTGCNSRWVNVFNESLQKSKPQNLIANIGLPLEKVFLFYQGIVG